ncbi:MAG: hypothetical protein WCT02_00275 [Candidatus Paceibacterota bacterium]
MKINRQQKQKLPSITGGMTLVEVLIAISTFVIVVVAVASFQANIFKYKTSVSGSYQTAQNAQVILKTALTEIREAGPGANGAYALINAGSTTLSFFSDANNDGLIEKITYTLMGTTLYRATINPTGNPVVYNLASQATTTLLERVVNGITLPVFQYFDTNYSGTTSPMVYPISNNKVRLVKINVKIDLDPLNAPAPIIYSVQGSIRNLKSNL